MIKYIVIQAGGKGKRMGHLTENKPKALVPVNNEPIIIRTMKLFPKSKILIIADYKSDVLEKYLSIYSPTKNYEIVKTTYKYDGGGVKQCLKKIPANTPFLLLWCDLLLDNADFLKSLSLSKNYIGLSNQFRCRWKFQNGLAVEKPSNRRGIAGLFVFKNKGVLSSIPNEVEFCKYLRDLNVHMEAFFPDGIKEVGTLRKHTNFRKSKIITRPFNHIEIENNILRKTPSNEQGSELAIYEKKWYQLMESKKINSIPRIFSYDPISMEYINGKSLYDVKLNFREKNKLLRLIVDKVKEFHSCEQSKIADYSKNNAVAYILKTRDRISKVANLIPQINNDYITINGKKCVNIYKKINILEELMKPYYSNEYKIIHGDITFSNILYLSPSKIKIIDPRGYFGKEIIFGDEDYDWAKLYYSIVGDYDQFNKKNFKLSIDEKNISITIKSNGWHKMERIFFDLINRDYRKIKIIHAIIWLSLTSYTWEDYDSICAAFYKGVFLTNEILENNS